MKAGLHALIFCFPCLFLAGRLWGQDTVGFEPPVHYAIGTLPEDFALGDIDNDGIVDIVVGNSDANNEGGGNTISALLGNGDGTFTVLPEIATGDRPEGLALAFIDGDGFLDVATSDHEGNTVSVLLGNGDGTFSPALQTNVPGGPRDVVAGDFNEDGKTDLATADYNGDTVSILLGDGAGSFTVSSLAAGEGTEQLTVANVNGDSHQDIVAANRDHEGADSTISVFLGVGNGSFATAAPIEAQDESRFIVAADLDDDGLDDLVVTSWEEDNAQIFENLGGGDFGVAATLEGADSKTALGADVADVDGDGTLDILVVSANTDRVHVFLGSPNNPFLSRSSWDLSIETGERPINVVGRDLDGDGHLDLAISEARTDRMKIHRSYLGNPGVIVDNNDAGTSTTGNWSVSEGSGPFGNDSLSSTTGAVFAWEATLPDAEYEVFLWWTVAPNRFKDVAVDVDHEGGTASFEVDQRKGRSFWHSLGTFSFDGAATVVLTAPNNGSASACADAVRFVALDEQPNLPPMAEILTIAPNPATQGSSIEFEAEASDPDGIIVSQTWTSNLDGMLSEELNFDTTGLSPGVHEISLIVVDNQGLSSSRVTFELEVTPGEPPVAAAGEDQEVQEGEVVELNGSQSAPQAGGNLSYLWQQVSGKSVILQSANLPIATFTAPAVVVDESLVFQLTVTEGNLSNADTITVTVRDVGIGMASLSSNPRPADIALGDDRSVLGFHGTVAVANDAETTDWTRATFDSIGNDDPGLRITQCWLHLDSNGNGVYDVDDRRLGEAAAFDPITGTLTFDGFLETLVNNQPVDFFIVCELAPEVVIDTAGAVPGVALRYPPRGAPAAVCFALLALAFGAMLSRAGGLRGASCRLATVTCLLLACCVLPSAGCGSSGGSGSGGSQKTTGGGSAVQLRWIDLGLTGTSSGIPAATEGLPLTGWEI